MSDHSHGPGSFLHKKSFQQHLVFPGHDDTPIGYVDQSLCGCGGCVHKFKYAINKGYSKLWVEGDSMNIINYLCGTHPPSWNVDHLIKDTIIMLQSCDETWVSHVYREGNSLADFFANEAVTLNEFRSWEKGLILHKKARILLRNDGVGWGVESFMALYLPLVSLRARKKLLVICLGHWGWIPL